MLAPSQLRLALSTTLVLLLAAACGDGDGDGNGGGGGGGGSDEGLVDVFVTDAPADELLSFQVTITELRLDGPDGMTADQLSGPVTVELLGLSDSQKWLVHEDSLPAGTYDSIRVVLQPGSVVAHDKQGATVPLNVVSHTFVAPLAAPLTIAADEDVQLLIDLQLAASLSGTTAVPPLTFEPTGHAVSQSLATATSIDEIRGLVQSVDTQQDTLTIDAFADGDLSVHLGTVTVAVSDGTLLIDDDGAVLGSSEDFLDALVPETTMLEVHGAVKQGMVLASRIEIEDQLGGQGSEDLVKIEGHVLDLDTGAQTFDLLIVEIEKGASVAGPTLGTLGDPAVIPVQWSGSTLFFQSEDELATSSVLAEGARVEVKFAQFGATPFQATKIELEDGPDVEGEIVGVSGLPASVVIHVDADEPSIASGQVASPTTPVTVDLTDTKIFLDTQQEPTLAADQLQPGLKVEAREIQFTGPPSGPTIAPSELKVFAGRFEGHVTSVSPGLSSFNATMTELKDPFGDSVTFGPVTVELAPGAVLDGDADDAQDFFELFDSLEEGQALEVEVFGIGGADAGTIVAHEVQAKVD